MTWFIWAGLLGFLLSTIVSISFYLIGRVNFGNEDPLDKVLAASQYRSRSEPAKIANNDPLARNRIIEQRSAKMRKEMEEMGVIRYDPNEELDGGMRPRRQGSIVGLAEVKGFWSRFVMGQKLGYLKMRASLQFDNQNFWATLIKAQAASQGKDQSRNR